MLKWHVAITGVRILIKAFGRLTLITKTRNPPFDQKNAW